MGKNNFYWVPRVLSIVFIAFISIFSLDVLGTPQWFLALLIHLIPSFMLVILTAISWKNEKVGGILFLIGSLASIGFFHSTIIAVPTFIIGMIFLTSSLIKK